MPYAAVVDYSAGNLSSVMKALERTLAMEIRLAPSPVEARNADALILPGVGNFGDGMAQLEKRAFPDFIRGWVAEDRPFLGICLGMQMLLESSEEAPGVKGIGVFKGTVRRFVSETEKIPHMGWNTVCHADDDVYFKGLGTAPYFYFVHSYYVDPEDSKIVSGRTFYIKEFASVLSCGGLIATQFHPEKSQTNGLSLLEAFASKVKGEKK